MNSLKDHKGKPSMMRLAMFWILLESSIIIVVGLIFAFLIIWWEMPEFIALVLGVLGVASVPAIISLFEKVAQAKIEWFMNGNGKKKIVEEEKTYEGE